MKISIVLTFCLTMQITAGVYSQDARLKLVNKQNTMADVIDAIENQTEYKIFYRTGQFDTNMPVSLTSTDQTVASLLVEAFGGSSYTYKLLDKIIVIAPTEALQQQTITGTVSDATTNEPLPGVNVLVEGTTVGVTTDMNGKYSIKLPSESAVLVFSYIGYISQRVETLGKTELNIALSADVQNLEEVVVVGYGTMKKLDVSGSIVSANAKVIGEVPSTSATAALQGRLPGIEMAQVSTRPGSNMQIRIRGERSLNATNDPLIVVDGIPFSGSISDISPSDIKSVDILKDASSTAIYGSRGANGVVLITTFRGAVNGEPTISYNGYYGIKTVAKKYEMYNAEEFQALRHATSNTSYKDQFTDLEKASIASGNYTDWQDLMYDNARVTNHDLSISSGSKKGAYSLGAGYYNETAVLPGQEYSRYSIRTTVDQEIGKYLKIGLSSQNSYGITDGESASLMNNILTLSPLMPAYNDDGSIRKIPTAGWIDEYYNPLLLNDSKLWQERRKRFATYNSLYGEIKFTESLRYRINLGLSYYKEDYGNFYAKESPFQNGSDNTATVQGKANTVWAIENLLYYDKVIAQKHRINVTAMYSTESSEFSQSQVTGTNLPADYLYYFNLALANGNKTIEAKDSEGKRLQDFNKRGLISYMGRIQYSFADRYMLTATFRADGASVLAEGHKWHNYPAFSAGWNINKESFMSNISSISQLKLRVGYGQTSNQAISPYATVGELGQIPYNFGATNAYGYLVTNLPNYNLGWEFTENYNGGLDFGFFDGRINGYVDYYFQKTKDVLVQVKLPVTSGVDGRMWQNVGSTENKGIEFSVSAQIIKPENKGGFGWDVDFNIYANRNKLVSLNSGVPYDKDNGFFPGHPINVIYDYEKLGIIQQNEAPYFGYTAGKIKVADLSGKDGVPDGQISSDYDKKILGSFEPDFAGGFTTHFSYRSFDFSVVSFFKSGGMLVSTLFMPQSYLNTNNARRNTIKVDYWTPEHPSGTYPQPGNQSSADQNDFGNTLGYFDASFLKVRTITLGYTLDTKLLSYIGGKSARVYFTCQNPFTLFSPYMDEGGLDPEATGIGPQAANSGLKAGSGIQDRQLTIGANTPPTRNFIVGLSVRF